MQVKELRTPKWSGSLKSKKKTELQQICRELDIEYRADALKADLELQIRTRFKDSPALQTDARFAGLDYAKLADSPSASSSTSHSSAPLTRRAASRFQGDDDDDASSSGGEPNEKPVSRRLSPRKSSVASSQAPARKEIAQAVQAAEKEVSQVLSKTATVVGHESSQAAQLVKQTSQQALESFNSFARCTARCAVATLQAAQTTLSSPWNLCILTVMAELAFVLHSTVPASKQANTHAGSGKFVIQLPDSLVMLLHTIFSLAFLRPLVEYSSLTIIGPLILAGLMNVPSSRGGGKNFSMSDLKPSAFAYCATRLAVVALMNSVFTPAQHYGWASQQPTYVSNHPPFVTVEESVLGPSSRNAGLIGFEAVQYVGTAFGLSIALHQLITQLQ